MRREDVDGLPMTMERAILTIMPELPEVETVCRGLALALEGRRLVKATTYRADLRRPFPPDFALRLRGRQIETISRRAKYLTLFLDDGWVWLAHLGMSGRMLVSSADDGLPAKHDHLVVETDQGRRGELQ